MITDKVGHSQITENSLCYATFDSPIVQGDQ